ncbi:MerR family transcriptional regulator, partial [Microcoleus sp.]|uniref:MerR family transcriptional regulator n=1 Tax=Microcoleus sp. TaxID=44472 RepID=UPI003523B546
MGLSVKTLQRWDVSGKLPAKRTLSGHRFYTEDDFAFEFIQELAVSVGCEIIVANQESLSPQHELVEDLMAIIHWNAKESQTCGMVIADCGFHEFKRQLEYKAKKFGCEIVVADRW